MKLTVFFVLEEDSFLFRGRLVRLAPLFVEDVHQSDREHVVVLKSDLARQGLGDVGIIHSRADGHQ